MTHFQPSLKHWVCWTLSCVLFGLTSPVRAEHAQADSLHVDFSAGLGLGGRAIERPTLEGSQRIGPGYFPAADISVRAQAWPNQPIGLGFWLRYQTTLVDTAWEHPPRAPDNELRVRCHHVELAAQPWLRPAADSGWSLGIGFGYSMRVFWPDVHNLQTPRQFITGPFLRPELLLSGLGPISLRLGPELFYILTRDASLRAAIGDQPMIALGGQLSIIADVSESFALELMYRESHVLLAPRFRDVERFATALLTRRF